MLTGKTKRLYCSRNRTANWGRNPQPIVWCFPACVIEQLQFLCSSSQNGSKNICDDYCTISLLSKVLVKFLSCVTTKQLTWITVQFPPWQWLYSWKSPQDKSIEQEFDFYLCFIDFTKSFNLVTQPSVAFKQLHLPNFNPHVFHCSDVWLWQQVFFYS